MHAVFVHAVFMHACMHAHSTGSPPPKPGACEQRVRRHPGVPDGGAVWDQGADQQLRRGVSVLQGGGVTRCMRAHGLS